MQIKHIDKNNEKDINAYIKFYWESYFDKDIKPEYPILKEEILNYTYIFGLYKSGKLVGGYVLNNYPARILVGLPDDIKKKIINDFESNGSFIEASAFWKKNHVNFNIVWFHLIYQIIKLKPKSYYYSAYKGHKMFSTYKYTSTEILYDSLQNNKLCIFKSESKYYIKAVLKAIFFRIIRRKL